MLCNIKQVDRLKANPIQVWFGLACLDYLPTSKTQAKQPIKKPTGNLLIAL